MVLVLLNPGTTAKLRKDVVAKKVRREKGKGLFINSFKLHFSGLACAKIIISISRHTYLHCG